MKKTLIALAVAASAVSGMAHAWTNGDFNGSVDIGGSITADDDRQKWLWAVGSDINGFNNSLKNITENKTKLTITVNSNKPILLGKTNEAFSTPVAGGVGAIPQIAFTGYDGTPVELKNPDGVTDKGLAYMVLPMKNEKGDKLGSVTVNASYAGAVMVGKPGSVSLRSLYGGSNNVIFNGGLPINVPGSEFLKGDSAASRTELFGSLSASGMLKQLQGVYPDITTYDIQNNANENMQYTDGTVVSAAYALGIADGQTIELTFDKAVTASTKWSAPLNVAVTYN
ncbi:fimbrial protein [Escherichia coli]|uniref:Fimbrial protein n=1 Tax=Escherichia coli TaxID=562 RepID=A0A8S7NUE4_ECOLX|nr:fimbrial protein [Escherichia coli]HDQ6531700.1 fimbrial protein [Escherichia coli O75:H8]EER0450274.1 fimbrial protein [Escherichia coli]EER3339983.1 fimbrial protein [Escherichia coli]EES5164207.1 fimbrial protein [Escherichia coli]EEU1491865.1 fimbrial protein [Escherichia coli]